MTPEKLFEEVAAAFKQRKFAAGLLVAMIDFLNDVQAASAKPCTFKAFLADFPRQKLTAKNTPANTLIVRNSQGVRVSLRPYYNKIEKYFRAEKKRFEYPSAAPHATQAWEQHQRWLDALLRQDRLTRQDLRQRVIEFVLDQLPSHEFTPLSEAPERHLFVELLRNFDVRAMKGETTGSCYQGIAFGFIRADNPHLQVEIDKVRVGSKRLQRVGDVDGWDGSRLALSAEVKQFVVSVKNVSSFADFGERVRKRSAIGLVVALGFEDGVIPQIEAQGLHPLDRESLLSIASLWDPLKQQIAVKSLVYYVEHVEKNKPLLRRITEFVSAPGPRPE